MEDNHWNTKCQKKHSVRGFCGTLEILNNFPFKGNENAIDIGCGDGKITVEIANHLPNGTVLGIDASESMILACKQVFGHIKNLSFQCISAEKFVTSTIFDIAVSFFTLHWIENPHKALNNIYQMLKNNGVLIITCGNCPEIAEVFERENWKTKFPIEQKTWHGKTAENYKQMLVECGFKNIRIKIVRTSRFFNTTEAFVDYAMGWVPHATGLPNDQAFVFAHDLADNIRTKMKSKDDRIELISSIATIWSQKS